MLRSFFFFAAAAAVGLGWAPGGASEEERIIATGDFLGAPRPPMAWPMAWPMADWGLALPADGVDPMTARRFQSSSSSDMPDGDMPSGGLDPALPPLLPPPPAHELVTPPPGQPSPCRPAAKATRTDSASGDAA